MCFVVHFTLALDQVHQPACRNCAKYQDSEGKRTEPYHHFGDSSLSNAEHDGDAKRENQHGTEMTQHQEAFLPLASECASIAEMIFNSPPTTMNLLP